MLTYVKTTIVQCTVLTLTNAQIGTAIKPRPGIYNNNDTSNIISYVQLTHQSESNNCWKILKDLCHIIIIFIQQFNIITTTRPHSCVELQYTH